MSTLSDSALEQRASKVANLAMESGIRIGTAESCTGGLIAHLLTRVPGISAVFMGGIVAYANEAKVNLLDVPRALLDEHGAVSETVGRAMSRGARRQLDVDLAVATTGIAGPGGSTPEKPTGLTFIAVSGPNLETCRRFQFDGDRAENIDAAALHALRMLEDALYTILA